jgi:hypothetical protein
MAGVSAEPTQDRARKACILALREERVIDSPILVIARFEGADIASHYRRQWLLRTIRKLLVVFVSVMWHKIRRWQAGRHSIACRAHLDGGCDP